MVKDHLTLATLGPEPEVEVPRKPKRSYSHRSNSSFNTMPLPRGAMERVTGKVVPECPEWMRKPSKPLAGMGKR
jgi:hypothetical protein